MSYENTILHIHIYSYHYNSYLTGFACFRRPQNNWKLEFGNWNLGVGSWDQGNNNKQQAGRQAGRVRGGGSNHRKREAQALN